MAGHADRHGVEPGPSQVADGGGVADRGDDGQRAGPEGGGQGGGAVVEGGDPGGRRRVVDVGDQGIEARPTLGFEDRGDGGRIGRVGPQAIDRFGRQQDEAPVAEGSRGGVYFFLAVMAKLTFTFAPI